VSGRVASHVEKLPFSGIRKFFDVANEMEGAISLGVGEPDFETPWHIREEAVYRLEHGRTAYTANAGDLELRREISRYLRRKYGLEYDPRDQICVTVGGSEGIDLAMRAVINPGDEVMVVDPGYVAYIPCVLLAGGVPAVIPARAERRFRVRAEDVEAAVTPRTKALVINYPCNPTGAVLEKEDLAALAEVVRRHDLLLISDETYSELTYTETGHVSIASLPGMAERTIYLSSFSKAFSMTGWRLGYACGPAEILSAMVKIHQYVIMCAPTVSQHAGIEALRNGDASVEAMRKEYDQRRRVMVSGFRRMGMDCFEPQGAFYVFPSIQKTGLTSEEFCNRLLREQKLAVVPGTAFGESGEGYVRCSYAYSIESLREALGRIEKFIGQFSRLGIERKA